jgi:hypothetical protein
VCTSCHCLHLILHCVVKHSFYLLLQYNRQLNWHVIFNNPTNLCFFDLWILITLWYLQTLHKGVLWYLELQLPVQSVPIATKVMSSNLALAVVFSAPFNNISVISWRSVLLVLALLNVFHCPKTWQYDQIQVLQLRTSSTK